jgi:hypothetical protein
VGTWLATCIAWLLASGPESESFGVAGLLWGMPWSFAFAWPVIEIGRRLGGIPDTGWFIYISIVGVVSMIINAWLLVRLGAWLQRIILRDVQERTGNA